MTLPVLWKSFIEVSFPEQAIIGACAVSPGLVLRGKVKPRPVGQYEPGRFGFLSLKKLSDNVFIEAFKSRLREDGLNPKLVAGLQRWHNANQCLAVGVQSGPAPMEPSTIRLRWMF